MFGPQRWSMRVDKGGDQPPWMMEQFQEATGFALNPTFYVLKEYHTYNGCRFIIYGYWLNRHEPDFHVERRKDSRMWSPQKTATFHWLQGYLAHEHLKWKRRNQNNNQNLRSMGWEHKETQRDRWKKRTTPQTTQYPHHQEPLAQLWMIMLFSHWPVTSEPQVEVEASPPQSWMITWQKKPLNTL